MCILFSCSLFALCIVWQHVLNGYSLCYDWPPVLRKNNWLQCGAFLMNFIHYSLCYHGSVSGLIPFIDSAVMELYQDLFHSLMLLSRKCIWTYPIHRLSCHGIVSGSIPFTHAAVMESVIDQVIFQETLLFMLTDKRSPLSGVVRCISLSLLSQSIIWRLFIRINLHQYSYCHSSCSQSLFVWNFVFYAMIYTSMCVCLESMLYRVSINYRHMGEK